LGVPKQVLPIVEVPMIERVLTHLSTHGVTDAVLSLGYKAESLAAVAPRGHCCGLDVSHATETEPLGTAGAIRFAAEEAGIDERFIVVNGDILTDLDLRAVVAFHAHHGGEATIALTRVDDTSAFGLVSTDDDGRVRAFVEKPPIDHARAGAVNAGTYVLEPSVLERIPPARPVSIEREVFPLMAAENTLYALASDAYWTDTGTPERYLAAQLDLLGDRRPGPPLADAIAESGRVWTRGRPAIHGTVTGPAFVGAGATVESGAHVVHSVVGTGAVVGEGAQVHESVLLTGAVVGSNCVVERSLVGDHAHIGDESTVTELSVIGPGVAVEPGSKFVGARVPDDAD
jgi:NDP-sugar pyrophosphorylase family protein